VLLSHITFILVSIPLRILAHVLRLLSKSRAAPALRGKKRPTTQSIIQKHVALSSEALSSGAVLENIELLTGTSTEILVFSESKLERSKTIFLMVPGKEEHTSVVNFLLLSVCSSVYGCV
jgi:hypothetical protein